LFFDVGYLEYVDAAGAAGDAAGSAVSGWWPMIVGVVAGVLVIVVVLVVVVFVRKSSYNERLYRRLQGQLDALETSVRNECKQGPNYNMFSQHT